MFRIIPWWLFALLALLFGFLSFGMVQDYRADQGDLAQALASEPEVMAARDLPSADRFGPFDEFAITDFASVSAGTIDAGRNGRAFLVVASHPDSSVFVAFTDIAIRSYVFEAEAERIGADWESYVLRGLRSSSSSYRSDIIDALQERGYWQDGATLVMAEFLEGERETALRGYVGSQRTVAIIAVAVTVILALAAVVKYRKWRKRRAAKRLAAQGSKTARFDNGPIDSGGR
jgi:hypothetical protein